MRKQFLRFLAVGALNTGFGYLVFTASILIGLAAPVALVLTYVIGTTFNYFTTGRLVFHESRGARFFVFVLAYVVIYVFNAVLYEIVKLSGAGPLVTQAVCVPVVAVFSFVLFKLHVFKDVAGADGGPPAKRDGTHGS